MKTIKILFLLFGALVGLTACLPSGVVIYPTVTPVPSINHTIDNLIGIEPIWILDNVYVIWNEHDVTLDSSMGKTCFLGDLSKRDLYENFICLESRNGRLLWSKKTGVHRTIDVSQDGIFIAYSSPGEIKKYDLNSGELVWRKKLGGTGSISLIYLDNQIQVSTTNPETLWVLDTDGNTVRRLRDGEHRIFLSTPDVTYINLNGLQVLRTGTDEVLWEYIDVQRLRQSPIFTEDKIFLRTGETFSGTAYALERTSGVRLWDVSNVVGNLVYAPDKHLVYALQADGNLLAIEENTGEMNVIATFSPSSFIFFDGIDTCAYQLAYDSEEHILFTYLGDSRQLLALRLK